MRKRAFWMVLIAVGICASARAADEKAVAQSLPASSKRSLESQSEETLLNTLNETLEENQKVRSALKEVQQALQRKTIESEDLKSELRKLEGLALERNRELGQKIKALDEQIKSSAEAEASFKKDKDDFEDEKKRIEEEVRQAKLENSKLKKMLSRSILSDEKEELLQLAHDNGEVARRAEVRLTHLNSENQNYRNALAASQYELGNLYFQNKRYSEAAGAYQKALDYDPANAWAYHNLAVVQDYYLNDPKSASLHYQKYLDYKPADEEAQAIRRRILDINMLEKVSPNTPLRKDFDAYHQETRNAKL